MPGADIAGLARRIEDAGLVLRGGFHPEEGDGVPALPGGVGARTLLLLGWVGRAQWPRFATSPEAGDGDLHPLDRWSRRVVDAIAAEAGAVALYPFGPPPYHPFQRWAQRAEPVFASPLGLLVHARHGLWHSYRGALAFAGRLALTPLPPAAGPCGTCAGTPCLSACPVGAFTPGRYHVDRCAEHLRRPEGRECVQGGCLARRACPVGAGLAYGPAQTAFYMDAFLAAR